MESSPFLINYRLLNYLTFFLSLTPFLVSKNGQSIECKWYHLIPIVLNSLLLVMKFVINYTAYLFEGLEFITQNVMIMSSVIRALSLDFTILVAIIFIYRKRKLVMQVVNGLAIIDHDLCREFQFQANYKKIMTSFIIEYLIMLVVHYFLVLSNFIGTFDDLNNGWEIGYSVIHFWEVMFTILMGCHIRNCAKLIYLQVENLEQLSKPVFQSQPLDYEKLYFVVRTHQRLWKLYKNLEKAFGIVMLFSLVNDSTTVTIEIYLLLMNSQGSNILRLHSTSFLELVDLLSIVSGIFRFCYFLSMFSKLGDKLMFIQRETIKLRYIKDDEKRDNFIQMIIIKTQQMMTQRYLNAGGLFLINYNAIYIFGTSLATHILILLQFQQTEDEVNINELNNNE